MHQPGFPGHGALHQPPLPGWSWTKRGKLLPRSLHTDRRMLLATRTHSEEPWPNQTGFSGHLSECFQLPFPATETLNIKQRELIYTWDIDTKQKREEEKDK